MAERNLRGAADLATAHPRGRPAPARRRGGDRRLARRRRGDARALRRRPRRASAGRGLHAPPRLGLRGHRATTTTRCFLHAPYFDIYRSQVVKQADLVAALFVARRPLHARGEGARLRLLRGHLTVRDSSLSACVQGVVAAEVGHLELAYDYFGEAARVDLDDLAHNTKDGLHIASLAGSWLVAVCGFGGLRDHDGELSFAPRLPPALTRLKFAIGWRGQRLRVDITPGRVRYELIGDGGALELRHEGEALSVTRRRAAGARLARPRRGARRRASRTVASRTGARRRDARERFAGPGLDRAVWIDSYLPAWSSRAASRATWELCPGCGATRRTSAASRSSAAPGSARGRCSRRGWWGSRTRPSAAARSASWRSSATRCAHTPPTSAAASRRSATRRSHRSSRRRRSRSTSPGRTSTASTGVPTASTSSSTDGGRARRRSRPTTRCS